MDITLFLTVIEEDEKKRQNQGNLPVTTSGQSSTDNSTSVDAD